MTKTAVLYARVSTRGQAESGYSLRQQVEALRGWAAAEGYEISEVIEDAGYSGASLERPGLDRVRGLVAAGGVSVVLAQDRDRFAREPAYVYLLRREFEEHSTKIRSLADRGDESPEGELTDGILDQLAKFERAKIAERTRRGLDRKVAEGRLIRGPRAPYGFSYSEDGEALLLSEPQMSVVRRVFRAVGAEGETLGGLVKALTREGVPSPTGGNWHRPTLRYLVLNELYWPRPPEELEGLVSADVLAGLDPEGCYGLWCWNKRKQLRWRERTEDGELRDRYRTVWRPRSEWGAVPVDLSKVGLVRELVEAARGLISDRKRRPPSTIGRRFWDLSGGIVRCAECGSVLSPTAHPRRSGNGHRFYYTCRQRYSNGPRDCPSTRNNPAATLEEAVWNGVRRLLCDPERVLRQYEEHLEHRKAQLRGGDSDREARDLGKQLKELDRKEEYLLDVAADRGWPKSRLQQKLDGLEDQREALQKALREARDRQETIQRLQRDREIAFGRFSAMRGMDLRHLDPENRRRVLQALKLRVEVDKEGDARMSGVFDADITELLPMAQAPAEGPYTKRFRHEIPPPYRGVITIDNTRTAGCSPSPTTK